MEKLLPQQLKNPAFSFCKLVGKNPAINGKDWQLHHTPWQEAEKWLASGHNYGVMTGYGDLIVIDCDSFLAEAYAEHLPPTFVVQTGSGKTHRYYVSPAFGDKIILDDNSDGTHNGEVLVQGFQAVGPGSIHPDTQKPYTVLVDIPIAPITRAEILHALAPILKAKDIPEDDWNKEAKRTNIDTHIDTIKISDFYKTDKPILIKHPIHGATGEGNLHIDPVKNLWHCFRCGSGGGAISLFAVLNGIVDCSDCTPGKFRGEAFRKAAELAEKNGLIQKKQVASQQAPQQSVQESVAEPIFDFLKFETLKTITTKQFPPAVFILNPYFEVGTLNMVTAPPNIWKSWVLIDIAVAMARGEKWLGKYPTQKNKVWIINEEDSERNVSSRLEILGYKGMDLPVMISAMKGFSAENPKMVKALLAECKKEGVTVMMFDTLRAIHHGNENDSAVMQIVLDNLKLFSREGITVVFNHHHKKAPKDEKSKVPDAEMQRGSSAISAAVSGHISLEEEQREDGTYIILKHLKSKITEKDPPIDILINKKYKMDDVGNMLFDETGKRMVESIKFEVKGEYTGIVYAVEKSKEEVLKVLRERKDRWVSRKELNEICSCGKTNIDKSLVILLDNNLMHKSTRKNLGTSIAGKGAMNELFFSYRDTEQEAQSELEYEDIKGW